MRFVAHPVAFVARVRCQSSWSCTLFGMPTFHLNSCFQSWTFLSCVRSEQLRKKNNPRKQEAVPQNPAGFRSQQQSPWLGLVFPSGQFCKSYHGGAMAWFAPIHKVFPSFRVAFTSSPFYRFSVPCRVLTSLFVEVFIIFPSPKLRNTNAWRAGRRQGWEDGR